MVSLRETGVFPVSWQSAAMQEIYFFYEKEHLSKYRKMFQNKMVDDSSIYTYFAEPFVSFILRDIPQNAYAVLMTKEIGGVYGAPLHKHPLSLTISWERNTKMRLPL
jgi:hypothetical protein